MNQIRADVQNAQITIARARAQYAAAEKALAAQEVVVDAEERKFQLGASTLFVVIQQQNTLASSRQNLVNAQVAYANAKLALDVATGNLMDKYNIVFDEARDGTVTRRADSMMCARRARKIRVPSCQISSKAGSITTSGRRRRRRRLCQP